MNEVSKQCPECGAAWREGRTCQDDFHQLMYWEYENPAFVREVHHLMVLGYYLQHPSLYSPEGLQGAQGLLVDYVERGLAPADTRRRDRAKVDSGKRSYKIAGTAAAHGAYTHPIVWPMTAAAVVAGGAANYCENVRAWARSILEMLRATGNMQPM